MASSTTRFHARIPGSENRFPVRLEEIHQRIVLTVARRSPGRAPRNQAPKATATT
jgi:hypothetical protein